MFINKVELLKPLIIIDVSCGEIRCLFSKEFLNSTIEVDYFYCGVDLSFEDMFTSKVRLENFLSTMKIDFFLLIGKLKTQM